MVCAWLTTRDHKRIAILYAFGMTFFFFLGGAAATLIRLNLATPDGALLGAETILTGLNFIVTVHSPRTKAMTWFRLPLFVWGIYATSLVLVLATPPLKAQEIAVLADPV